MIPAALIILAVGAIFFVLWLDDRRELRRVKRDVKRALDRLAAVEERVDDLTIRAESR